MLALVALLARSVEELDETEQPVDDVAGGRRRRDGLGAIAPGIDLPDGRGAGVHLELEFPGQREARQEQETEVGPAGSDRLARHRDLHVWLHGQARRPRLVVDCFEEPVPHAERDVAEAGVVLRPSHANERIPLDVHLELARHSDAQIGLDPEDPLRRHARRPLAREHEPGLELECAAGHQPRALGDLRAIGLDLLAGRGAREPGGEQQGQAEDG